MDYRTDLPHKETAKVKYPDGVCGRPNCLPCRTKRLERGDGVSWGGLARMAAARRACGLPLDRLDVMALEHVPDPILLNMDRGAYVEPVEPWRVPVS